VQEDFSLKVLCVGSSYNFFYFPGVFLHFDQKFEEENILKPREIKKNKLLRVAPRRRADRHQPEMEQFLKIKEKLQKEGGGGGEPDLVVGGADEEDCGACKPRAGGLYGSDMRRRFRSQQLGREQRSSKAEEEGEKEKGTGAAATTTSTARAAPPQQQEPKESETTDAECYDGEGYWEKQDAPDIIELGQAGWTLLHSVAAYYPPNPSRQHQERMRSFLSLFPHLYPCKVCAKDFEETMEEIPPELESRDALSDWMCRAHNRVNRQLGKPLFPCERVRERWGPIVLRKGEEQDS
jgi:FAD-linked sulfhydryl oxidase